MTEIRKGYPPNIGDIRRAFPLSGREIFAWDGIIYAPSGEVSPALVAHEEVHFRQQRECGGPEIWWERYIASPAFRLEMETEAHIAEYRAFAAVHGRKIRRAYLDVVAKRLSSPLYGGMINRKAARAIILGRD